MEQTVFALTPAQHHLLAALSLETGKSMAALLDEALEGLRAHTPHTYTNSHTPTSQAPARPAWTADQNQRRSHVARRLRSTVTGASLRVALNGS